MKSFLEGRPALNSEKPSNGHNGNGFRPLFAVVRGNCNGAAESNGHSPAAVNGTDCAHGSPEIELVTEEGKIRRIIITCTCSERIELECEY
jgi:hypothetical protein